MIRRFIRWFARRELAADAEVAELDKAVAISTTKMLAYMQGHLDGVRAAIKVVEEEVEKSNALGQEEIETAKKRMLH